MKWSLITRWTTAAFFPVILCALLDGLPVMGQDSPNAIPRTVIEVAAAGQPVQGDQTYPAYPGEADPNAPWPEAEKKGLWSSKPDQSTAAEPVSAGESARPAPPEKTEQPSDPDPSAMLTTKPNLKPPPENPHEVSVSGDFLVGQGSVTMPFGFSLAASGVPGVVASVANPDRDSLYYGATISYSYGQAWYFDLSFAQGNSSGNADVTLGTGPPLPSDFEINDDWYSIYVRYTFPQLRGRRFSAYARAGATYVQAELTDSTVIPALGLYRQTDDTDEIQGNLGFGLAYSLYTSRRARLALQGEGEGFYGSRTQDSLEVLVNAVDTTFTPATIDNDVYGGIGRVTVRFEYRLGRSGLFKVFADGGAQLRYTLVDYTGAANQTSDELLWGPYVKVGARYSF